MAVGGSKDCVGIISEFNCNGKLGNNCTFKQNVCAHAGLKGTDLDLELGGLCKMGAADLGAGNET